MGLGDLLFKEKEDKYLKQIEDLQNYLKIKDDEISYLTAQLEEVTKEKDARISSKQLEIFEKNFKHNIEVAKKYRSILDSYNLDTEKKSYKYRVDLKYFYSEKKFEEVIKFLNENNKFFVDELNEEIFDNMSKEVKNANKAKQRFIDFKNGQMEWSITTLINKGEELSKLYSKSRKLMTIFSELYFEYLDDIANFDFMNLKSQGFDISEIEELLSITPFTDDKKTLACSKLRKSVEFAIDEIILNRQVPTKYSNKNSRIHWEELKKIENDPTIIEKLHDIHGRCSGGVLHNGTESEENPIDKDELTNMLREIKTIQTGH